mmetsp:Transcript_23631/g.52394  ORF Transcript_23631/g.52394 Transcript_23631/m.52394 type:complete len:277 (+) Transcript_23631:91-921(+)
MIYIFKVLCEFPAKLCGCGADACNKVCAGGCRGCSAVCAGFSHIFDRPLGCYVLMTLIVSTWTIVAAANAFKTGKVQGSWDMGANATSTEGAEKCTQPVPLFLGGSIAWALVNVCFAFYVQGQVWQGLMDLVDEEEEEEVTSGRRVKRRNMARLILDSAGNIFCHNIAFCIYFFLLIGSCFWYMAGKDWVQSAEACNPDGWPTWTYRAGIAYPVLVVCFCMWWVVMLHIDGCVSNITKPMGGLGCCFGRPPLPRSAASSGSDAEMLVTGASRNPRF